MRTALGDFCELCDDMSMDAREVTDGKAHYYLCGVCRTRWEEKLGYSHKFKLRVCSHCGHVKELAIVRYGKSDNNAKECGHCGKRFAWLEKEGHCGKCWKEVSKFKECPCPECGNDLDQVFTRTISCWMTRTESCPKCGYKSEPMKMYKVKPVVPPKVKPFTAEVECQELTLPKILGE